MIWGFAALSPCVMAATHCPPQFSVQDASPHDHHNNGMQEARNHCDGLAFIDCHFDDQNLLTGIIAVPDFTITPVLVQLLPVPTKLVGASAVRHYVLGTIPIPHPPLNLQHGVFLN